MIESKEELFKVAGRRTGTVEVDGKKLELVEMDVDARFDFVEFAKEHKGDLSLCYAFLLSRCCPVLTGTSPEEIKASLKSDVLAAAAIKIQDLSGILESTKKKPSPKKKSSSTG